MREIKFRAWDTNHNKYFMVEKMSFRTNYDVFRVWDEDRPDEFHIVNPDDCILEQYTGLKDQNGNEIYEGDILKSIYRNSNIKISIGVSKYIGCGVELYGLVAEYIMPQKNTEPFMYNTGRKDWEIIGNIHEGIK